MDSVGTPTGSDATHDVAREIVRLLATMQQTDPDSITPSTRLFDDLGMDSTTFLELLMDLETELGVEFDPYTLEPRDFETVRALTAYVRRQQVA